ncbi:MAG: DDE-type integrase/transposase/recombinase [Elusimicrobiota bacterium]
MERQIRVSTLVFLRWSQRRGAGRWDAARKLGLAAKTLYEWDQGWQEDRLTPAPRGRPAGGTAPEVRQQVLETLQAMGPTTGVPVLRALFPKVPKRELEELLHRYRLDYRRNRDETIEELVWTQPGAVWAVDYTDPPAPVDGAYRDILLVRDLASGKQLLALPVPRESGWATARALESLFFQHGAPLVLKSDNGSTLTARIVQELLADYQVLPLLSPPEFPQFNGACEAGIGSLKTRAHHLAARNARPAQWTCDDVEGARLMANETARPKGHHGPTPDQMWAARQTILADERDVFRYTMETHLEARETETRQRAKDEPCSPTTSSDNVRERAASVRSAIRHALEAHGYLVTRRRRIPLPVKSRKSAEIS